MRRRSGTVGQTAKTRRRKPAASKGRKAPNVLSRRRYSTASEESKSAQFARERDEALEQLSAASEVLKVISSSPGDLKRVFETILEKATRICGAKFGNLFLREGNSFRAVAVHGESFYAEWYRRDPVVDMRDKNFRGSTLDRLTRRKEVIHVPDLRLDQGYLDGNPRIVALVESAGARTEVLMPLLKDDALVGAIVIYRQEVRPFTDKQIELLKNFAGQAVIAIENTGLLNELRESLDRQTATSEVLKIIAASPGKSEPVFNAMLENATRICDAEFGNLWLREGDAFRTVVMHGATAEYIEARRRVPLVRPAADTGLGRVLQTKQVSQIADIREVPGYVANPMQAPIVQLAGARTMLSVPMLKEEDLLGVIEIYRTKVHQFADKQVELVQNFADQAVIAIENARLLNELRESLQQQTATSEVLKVISSSPGALEPVFQAILENATRICQAQFGTLNLYDGTAFRNVALHNPQPQFARRLGEIIRPHPESGLAQVARTRQIVHIDDIRTRQPYLDGDKAVVDLVDLAGARTVLLVPMLNEGELIGSISIYRQEVRPFSEKQIALVTNFAAQAVIAVENTRLLNELRQSLQQQTATADVLKVISRSTFDLQTVLDWKRQRVLPNSTLTVQVPPARDCGSPAPALAYIPRRAPREGHRLKTLFAGR